MGFSVGEGDLNKAHADTSNSRWRKPGREDFVVVFPSANLQSTNSQCYLDLMHRRVYYYSLSFSELSLSLPSLSPAIYMYIQFNNGWETPFATYKTPQQMSQHSKQHTRPQISIVQVYELVDFLHDTIHCHADCVLLHLLLFNVTCCSMWPQRLLDYATFR